MSTEPPSHPDLPISSEGVNLRDWFAGKAMCALIVANEGDACALGLGAARDAYAVADAMLTARATISQATRSEPST